jgi:hypothetical protein
VNVILTWSGTASHEIAQFFRAWLTDVLPRVDPWISDEDIDKGKKWFPELMDRLDKSSVSITFVTPENIHSPWIYYEVGVIAAKIQDGVVCPYLIGAEPSHVRDTPLNQFQCTGANKPDTLRLIRTINKKLGVAAHDVHLLDGNFNSHWPKLKRRLDQVMQELEPVERDVTDIDPPIEQQLSDEARTLLLEASQDPNRLIMHGKTMQGTFLQTNQKSMLGDGSARAEARWEAALEQLTDLGLVEPMGHHGSSFKVTDLGFQVADRIKARE